jgi:hypothetical protein
MGSLVIVLRYPGAQRGRPHGRSSEHLSVGRAALDRLDEALRAGFAGILPEQVEFPEDIERRLLHVPFVLARGNSTPNRNDSGIHRPSPRQVRSRADLQSPADHPFDPPREEAQTSRCFSEFTATLQIKAYTLMPIYHSGEALLRFGLWGVPLTDARRRRHHEMTIVLDCMQPTLELDDKLMGDSS